MSIHLLRCKGKGKDTYFVHLIDVDSGYLHELDMQLALDFLDEGPCKLIVHEVDGYALAAEATRPA